MRQLSKLLLYEKFQGFDEICHNSYIVIKSSARLAVPRLKEGGHGVKAREQRTLIVL